MINFYSKALGLLLWVREGHLGVNRDMTYSVARDQRKAVHPFPYVDRCLPITDLNDPMWSIKGMDPIIGPGETI